MNRTSSQLFSSLDPKLSFQITPSSNSPFSSHTSLLPKLTTALLILQESSHTVPHVPLYCTSTRPLLGLGPPTRRSGTTSIREREKEVNREDGENKQGYSLVQKTVTIKVAKYLISPISCMNNSYCS